MSAADISHGSGLASTSIWEIVQSYFEPVKSLAAWIAHPGPVRSANQEVVRLREELTLAHDVSSRAMLAAEIADEKAEQMRQDLAVMRARLQFIEKTLEISPMDNRARLQLVTMSIPKAAGTRH